MYNKDDIDRQAECEGQALRRQNKQYKPKHVKRQSDSHGKLIFDKLFK